MGHKRQEFAVIGMGRFGRNVALTLENNGHHVLGIDENEELIQHMAHRLTQTVVLDATNENALKAVDITSFETVVVAIGSDFEANLMTTVALKNLGVKHVICKAPTERQAKVLHQIGADRIVRPEHEAGVRLAEELVAPTMLEHFMLGPDTDYSIAEYQAPAGITCQTLRQSNLRQRFQISILLIKREDDIIVNPPPDAIIQPDDILVILGHDKDILRFAEIA